MPPVNKNHHTGTLTVTTQKNIEQSTWANAGLIILCIRFVQGFIFWGGGSRRFIYAPDKLDPYASQWMANKLQSAMPGALLGVNHLISFLLQHFFLLYAAIILFSLVELVSGIALMAGVFTRVAALITACLSILLMVIFGWEGGTCLDEWTMAVSNLAMGLTIAIAGGGAYSVDHYLMRRFPRLAHKKWFVLCTSGPISQRLLKQVSIGFLVFTMFFTLSTYDYYRGAILSRYHKGPVSPVSFHIDLSDGRLMPDGAATFTAYVDAGTSSQPSHIMRIVLSDMNGNVITDWENKTMRPPFVTIKNSYDYNKINVDTYGLVAPTSAKAVISLTPAKTVNISAGKYQLSLFTVGGQSWSMELSL